MKKLVFLSTMLFAFLCIYGAPINPTPFMVTQPNGDTITIIHRGDEFFSFYTTQNGIVIKKDTDGYWKYVVAIDGEIAVSTTKVISTSTNETITVNQSEVFEILKEQRQEAQAQMLKINSPQSYASTNSSTVLASVKTVGTIKVLTVLVEFMDVKFANRNTIKNEVEKSLNSINQMEYGSVKEYYKKASNGLLNFEFDVVGIWTSSRYRDQHGQNKEIPDAGAANLALDALDYAAALENINLSDYDGDGDGIVDLVHVVFAGQGEDSGGPDAENSIWPHYFPEEPYITLSSTPVNNKMRSYIITPEITKGNFIPIGTVCHELGHALGAPDFYDFNWTPTSELAGTGYWDLMGSGNWCLDYKAPSLPNPWIRTAVFDWDTPITIGEDNNKSYMIIPATSNNVSTTSTKARIFRINTNTPGEYFLLENRQEIGLPGQGMLVWHVHKDIGRSQNNNIELIQKLYPLRANEGNNIRNGSGNNNNDGVPFPGSSRNYFLTSSTTPCLKAWNNQIITNKNINFIQQIGENIIFNLNQIISGENNLCDTEIYRLLNIPSGATINWSYESPNPGTWFVNTPLSIVSGQGTSTVTVERGKFTTPPIVNPILRSTDYRLFEGAVVLKATVSIGGKQYVYRKTLQCPPVSKPVITSNGQYVPTWPPNQSRTYYVNETLSNPEDIMWTIEAPRESVRTVYGRSVIVTPKYSGTLKLTVSRAKSCPDINFNTNTYSISSPAIIWPMFSNPVNGSSAEISIYELQDDETNSDISSYSAMRSMSVQSQGELYNGAYRLELWHEIYGMVKSIDVDENNPSVTFNVDGLMPGAYHLRVIVGDEVKNVSQMIIR